MVYEDREDEFMDVSEQQLYEPDRYEEDLVDTFRERIPTDAADESAAQHLDDEALPDDEPAEAAMPTETKSMEDSFGESLSPEAAAAFEDSADTGAVDADQETELYTDAEADDLAAEDRPTK